MNSYVKTVVIAFFTFLSCHSVHGLIIDLDVSKEIKTRIKEAKTLGLTEVPREGDVAAVIATMKIGGGDEAWAILQMMKWNRRCEVRMQWWISNDHVNRILILACLLKNIKEEDYGSIIKEYREFSARFSEKEAKLRLSELELLMEILSKNEVSIP